MITGFSAKDYQFTFEQKDTDDSTSEYVGSLVFTEGDESYDDSGYIQAGTINTDK